MEFATLDSIVDLFDKTFKPYFVDSCKFSPEQCILDSITYSFTVKINNVIHDIPLMVGSSLSQHLRSELYGYFIVEGECKVVNTMDVLEHNVSEFGIGRFSDGRKFIVKNIGEYYIEDKYNNKENRWFIPVDTSCITRWSVNPLKLEKHLKAARSIIHQVGSVPSVEICVVVALTLDIWIGASESPPPQHRYLTAGPLMLDMVKSKQSLVSAFKSGQWNVRYLKNVNGVSDIMHHYSYQGDISSMLRVCPPVNRETMGIYHRLLNIEEKGKICIVETSDSSEAGTVKYMTHGSRMSEHSEVTYVPADYNFVGNLGDSTNSCERLSFVSSINKEINNLIPLILNNRFKCLIAKNGVCISGDAEMKHTSNAVYVWTDPNRIISGGNDLGYTAQYLYCHNHNPAVRATFACNMIKQTISCYPKVIDGMFNDTVYLVEGEQPIKGRPFKYPCGRNVVVAMKPWKGYNVEDALVITESCSKMFESVKNTVIKINTANCKIIYIVKEDDKINVGDVLATRYCPTDIDVIENITSSATGIVNKIYEGKYCIRIKVSYRSYLSIGDKMTSRHGQKGVVSLIIPDCDAPIINGKRAHVIMNPMSIPSRMTYGQILEMGSPVGGICFYMALKHQSRNKMLWCNEYPKRNELTLFPPGGKMRHGGVRFGQMEKDALMAAGAYKTLSHLFSIDLCKVKTCDECGVIGLSCKHDGVFRDMHRSLEIVAMYMRGDGKELLLNKSKNKYCIVPIDWSLYNEECVVNINDISDLSFGGSRLDVIGKLKGIGSSYIPIIPKLARTVDIEKVYKELLYTRSKKKVNNERNITAVMRSAIMSKNGAIRRYVEGKTVTHCVRAVIVPDPSLDPGTVLIPRDAMIGVSCGILNRAPTLTRNSLQFVNVIRGHTNCIHINPLLCKSFNADFDGDEMTVFGLMSIDAIREAKNLLPIIKTPLQDYVLAKSLEVTIEDLSKCDVDASRYWLENMVKCKARGREDNLVHMYENVGDVNVGGKIIGTIKSSYQNGLTNDEYYIQACAAREGIVAIGTAVPVTGDINRKENRINERIDIIAQNLVDLSGPDFNIAKTQEFYSNLTQKALDAFHHSGAAYESLSDIERLKKRSASRIVRDIDDETLEKILIDEHDGWNGIDLNIDNLSSLCKAFVKTCDYETPEWTDIKYASEILLFDSV